jgi:cholest-4-en-3-one 26-monooxygenase
LAVTQPANIDIYDPGIYEQGVPHDAFRVLRHECPVYFQTEPAGRGYYAITKYEDLVRITKDPTTFSSARGGTNIEDYPEEDLSMIRLLMLNMDPPQHNKFRRLVSSGFTPRMISRMEEHVRVAARTIIDSVAGAGECDFVGKIAAELPLQVIADLMGIPQDERHRVFDWSNRLIGFDDPEFQTSPEDARIAAMEMWMYANQLAEGRKGGGGTDLTSVLINATVDGEKLTEMEFDSFFLLLSVAGNETTRNLISGGMLALIEHPEQRRRVLDDMSLLPAAVDEMLRWVSPVLYFRRTVTAPVEIRGVQLQENDKVAVYYISANRDEDIFENPDVFDVGRSPNDHVAFGVGQHSCLGLSLARLEIKVIFEELLQRIPDMELTGDVRRLRSNFINGIKEMPVRFTPEAR